MLALNKDSTMSKMSKPNAKGSYYTEYTRDIFNIMLSIKLSQLPVECHVINEESVKGKEGRFIIPEPQLERMIPLYQQPKRERRKTK